MKKVKAIILTLLIGLLFSCTSRDANEEKTSSTNFKTTDTIISFTGYWLSKDYYENLKDLKSPKIAQDNSEFIYIPNRTLKHTMMISNFHEGGSVLTVLKNTAGYEMWTIQDDSLIQQAGKIKVIDEGNIDIDNRPFVKINSLKNENGALILEDILFKGLYTDSSGVKIEFKNNGHVMGLDKFKIYDPIIDYLDAGREVDQVGLGSNKNDIEYFGFKFNADTLSLFNLNCLTIDSAANRCVEVEFGKRTHKIWRKK